MRQIIVEDPETDREYLKEPIGKELDAGRQAVDFSSYGSGEALLGNYRAGICNALFLDISMDGLSGIDVAGNVRETEPRLPIIFT